MQAGTGAGSCIAEQSLDELSEAVGFCVQNVAGETLLKAIMVSICLPNFVEYKLY